MWPQLYLHIDNTSAKHCKPAAYTACESIHWALRRLKSHPIPISNANLPPYFRKKKTTYHFWHPWREQVCPEWGKRRAVSTHTQKPVSPSWRSVFHWTFPTSTTLNVETLTTWIASLGAQDIDSCLPSGSLYAACRKLFFVFLIFYQSVYATHEYRSYYNNNQIGSPKKEEK